MSEYGMWGEIGLGVIGGVGSCWNTPIETIRVLMQRDVSMGKQSKPLQQYWNSIVEEQGREGLFCGHTSWNSSNLADNIYGGRSEHVGWEYNCSKIERSGRSHIELNY
jgi:Mitochondrial carrier protein